MNNNDLAIKDTFALAVKNHKESNFGLAKSLYQKILKIRPNHFESNFLLGSLLLQTKDFPEAVEMLKRIETEFFYDILADDAVYILAEIYQKKLHDKEKAKALYEKILLEFKGSIYTSEARKRFRKLRGDNLEEKENL